MRMPSGHPGTPPIANGGFKALTKAVSAPVVHYEQAPLNANASTITITLWDDMYSTRCLNLPTCQPRANQVVKQPTKDTGRDAQAGESLVCQDANPQSVTVRGRAAHAQGSMLYIIFIS